jgi:hypothetical protein
VTSKNTKLDKAIASKLDKAIASGRAEARRREQLARDAVANAVNVRDRERSMAANVYKKWLATSDRLYEMVRKAEAAGQHRLELYDHHVQASGVPFAPDALVDAVRSFRGFDAVKHKYETNMGDSSAPCWETDHKIVVTWESR